MSGGWYKLSDSLEISFLSRPECLSGPLEKIQARLVNQQNIVANILALSTKVNQKSQKPF